MLKLNVLTLFPSLFTTHLENLPFKRAIANKSLEIKPDFFRAFGYRSFLFLELGEYNKSYSDALKSVELNPTYGYGYMMLAQAKQKLGMPDFCIDLYNSNTPCAAAPRACTTLSGIRS